MRFLFVCLCATGLACSRGDQPLVKVAPMEEATAKPVQSLDFPPETTREGTGGAGTASSVRVVQRRKTYTTGKGRCAVDVAYPEIVGLSSPETLAKVNRLIDEAVLATVPESCRTPHDASPTRQGEGCSDLPDPGKTDVSVAYLVGVVKDGLLSVRLQRIACTNPSLQPDDLVDGLTVNLVTGTVYQVADLFRPGTPWKETMTQAVQEKLSATTKVGANVPISVNRFFLKEGTLVVLRPVSARAFHALDVEVPLKQLQPMLRADFSGSNAGR
ncbi:hypothetical protein [Archangium violaceum]|uniref:hypothetical protein n=1 Tax=Archangium violaceum TaxID=83451 RepID=UPI001269B643|nr:hypothetical protein [Archangium violaceum]